MPIQSGDRLKTEKEFYDIMVEKLNQIDPRAASQCYQVGSTLDTMLRTFARLMSEQQSDYHRYILSMGYGGVMPGDTVVRRPELERQPYVKEPRHICEYEEKVLFTSTYKACKTCGKEP